MRRTGVQLLSTRKLADALGVSESSIKRWVDDGEIAAVKTAGGHRRIPVPAAVGFIRRHRMSPAKLQSFNLPQLPAFGPVDPASAAAFRDALISDDPAKARSIAQGRYLAGAEIAQIADQLVQPALEHLGKLWKNRKDGVLLEHRAVQTCSTLAAELLEWLPRPSPVAPVALTCGPSGDPYLLAPAFSTLTLVESGWNAINLGPDTPLSSLVLAATRYSAALAALSISAPQKSVVTAEWHRAGRRLAACGCTLIVGGRRASTLPASVTARIPQGRSMTDLGAFARSLLPSATGAAPQRRRRSV